MVAAYIHPCLCNSQLMHHAQISRRRSSTQERAPKPESLQVAELFEVPNTSIYNRVSAEHTDASVAAHRRLSIPQEQALLSKINEYASRVSFLVLITSQSSPKLSVKRKSARIGRPPSFAATMTLSTHVVTATRSVHTFKRTQSPSCVLR